MIYLNSYISSSLSHLLGESVNILLTARSGKHIITSNILSCKILLKYITENITHFSSKLVRASTYTHIHYTHVYCKNIASFLSRQIIYTSTKIYGCSLSFACLYTKLRVNKIDISVTCSNVIHIQNIANNYSIIIVCNTHVDNIKETVCNHLRERERQRDK